MAKRPPKSADKALLGRTRGFTIIEIMIVLAVASLIMLIVFLAVPALQRNARNTNRTSDATKIASGVNECLSDHNNVVNSCVWYGGFLTGSNATLDTSTLRQLTTVLPYHYVPSPPAFPTDNKTAYVYFGEKCNSDGSSFSSGNASEFVILYNAESSTGGNVARCLNA